MVDRGEDLQDQRRVSRAPVAVVVVGLGLAVVLVLVGAMIAASPAPAPDTSRPGTVDAPRPVNVILRDYRFDPTPLHLVAGETVRFNLVNGGLVEHEFVLGSADVQRAWAEAHARTTPPAPFATRPPVSVPSSPDSLRVLLASGRSTAVTYDVPTGTELELYCHLPGHAEQGMIGQVVTVDRGP